MPEITADSAEAIALELLITVARAEGVHLDKEKGGWSREKILVTYRQCLAAVKRRAAGGGTASASQLGRARHSPAASDPSSFPATRPRPILRDRTIDPSRRSRDKGRLSRGGVPARVPLGSPTTAGRAGASWVSGPTVYWTPPRVSSPQARRRRITPALSRALCRSPYRFVAWLAGSRSPPRRLRTALPLGRESAAPRGGFAIDNL